MGLSFGDKESFEDAVGSLRFDNPPSDLSSDPGQNTLPQIGSSSMLPQGQPEERNEVT